MIQARWIQLAAVTAAVTMLAAAAPHAPAGAGQPGMPRFGSRPAALLERAAATAPDAVGQTAGPVSGAVRLTSVVLDVAAAGSKPSAHAWRTSQTMTARRMVPLLVQCAPGANAAVRDLVKAQGGVVCGYVPDQAYLVELPADRIAVVGAAGVVRWWGEYQPEYKLSTELCKARQHAAQAQTRQAAAMPRNWKIPDAVCARGSNAFVVTPPATTASVAVTINLFAPADLAETMAVVRDCGGTDVGGYADESCGRIRATLPFAALAQVAQLAAVQWIEEYHAPQLFNNVAVRSHLMNVTPVWQTNWLGLTGMGQIVAQADTGLDTGNSATLHPDFTNRVRAAFAWGRANVWSDPDGHGTHTAGSLFGNGTALSNGLFKGVAYEGRLVHQSLYQSADYPLGGMPTNLALLFEQAYATNARIHSDSWGISIAGVYDSGARDADAFMWSHPDMLLVFAAGNSSYDATGQGVVNRGTLGSPGCAKNLLCVGASESDRPAGSGGYSSSIYGSGYWEPNYPVNPIHDDLVSTSADGLHQGMFAMSSRGPTADGRVKPEVVAPGTDIISCRSHASGASTGWGVYNNNYIFLGGTSMATPLVAGAAALVRQYFMEKHANIVSNPSAALLKATLLNGARTLTPGQYGYAQYREIPPGPRPNVVEGWGQVNLAATLTNIAVWDQQSLSNGMTAAYAVTQSDTNMVSITLAWTDYPGTLGAAQVLVNDLDLRLITPDGVTHYPNGLTGPDHTNNVEGIDVAVVPPGVCTVLVSGVVNMGGAQPYALVLRGATPIAAQHAVESVSYQPATVRPGYTPLVSAVVLTNASGLADVTVSYRVDHSGWISLPLLLQMPFETGGIYTNALPAQAMGALVEFNVTAVANDSTTVTSPTKSYTVGDYAVFVWQGGSQTPPYATWATGFSNVHQALISPFVTEGYIINVTNGIYLCSDSGSGDGLIINKSVRLVGVNGAAATVLNGRYLGRCLTVISPGTEVEGFTIRYGWSYGNQGIYGGGVYLLNGVVRNCVIHDSYAYALDGNGGGLAMYNQSLLDSCVVHDNHAWGSWDAGGGGVVLSGNACARNTLFVYNEADSSADNGAGGNVLMLIGGTLSNCTVAAGRANYVYAGGVYMYCTGAIHNSIVYFNTNGNFRISNSGNPYPPLFRWEYSCVTPLPSGTGVQNVSNIVANPQFANDNSASGDCHLKTSSPCRKAGQFLPWMTNALDAEGHARVTDATVDMGALEYGPFSISFGFTPATGLAPLPVRFAAYPSGANTNGVYYHWDFNGDDVTELAGTSCNRPTNFYAEGFYVPALVASNELGELGTWQRDYVYAFNTNIHYVALSGGHSWPFTSLATASTNINEAMDACLSGHGVVISDGVYRLAASLVVGANISLRGLNGRDKTVLNGQRSGSCLMLNPNAVADGITVSNGNANIGGGVFFNEGGTLRNARIVNNQAGMMGGGVYFSYGGTLTDAIVMNNSCGLYGGGMMFSHGGLAQNCIVMNNSGYDGGGLCLNAGPAVMRNCLIANNTASFLGGGVSATPGTADVIRIENCTIANNTANTRDGGLFMRWVTGTICNTILHNNRVGTTTNNWTTNENVFVTLRNICTSPRLGTNWQTNDPRFVSSSTRNYRLRGDSYCINAGQTLGWMSGAGDPDGNARVINGLPDIGAYELNTNVPLLRITATGSDANQLSALNFGVVVTDTNSSRTLCVRNAGGSVLTGAVSGLPAPFASDGASDYTLAVNATGTLTFVFAPPLSLVYTSSVAFTGGGDVTVLFRGTGVPEPVSLFAIIIVLQRALRVMGRPE